MQPPPFTDTYSQPSSVPQRQTISRGMMVFLVGVAALMYRLVMHKCGVCKKYVK